MLAVVEDIWMDDSITDILRTGSFFVWGKLRFGKRILSIYRTELLFHRHGSTLDSFHVDYSYPRITVSFIIGISNWSNDTISYCCNINAS